MLIYSNVKNSTKNKPLTVCTCWNSYLWIDLWHGWLAFWGQNLCSWVNCILGIGADIRLLTHKLIFFFFCFAYVFISCWILLQEKVLSLQPKTICSLWWRATSPSLTGTDTDSYQESICLLLFLWKLQAALEKSKGERNCKWGRERNIWESSLNNRKTDGFQTKTAVI